MAGCIAPQLPGDDEAGDDEGGATATSGAFTTFVTEPTTDTDTFSDSGEGGSVSLTGSNDSISTTDCFDCTATSGWGDSGGTAEGGGPYVPEVCGVEIEYAPEWNNTYICGCEACNVEFNHLEPASGEALLAQCECICYEVGCGGSVTGGATSETPGESGWSDTGDTFGETGVDTESTFGESDTHPTGAGSSDDDGTASASASAEG